MKALIHVNVILPNETGDFCIKNDYAILYEETIHRILPMSLWDGTAKEVLDVKGQYVSPGFINIHVHGCGGMDTMDEDPEALPVMARIQASMGVTSFLPTTMSYDIPRIHRAFHRIRECMEHPVPGGARILGCHMEGPYISPDHRGAQAETYIRRANAADLKGFERVVKLITLAPETLPDWSFAEYCQQRGILLSIGHTSASYEQAMEAVEHHGIRHFTHLFNAMTGFHHRNPGAVGAALDTGANCELIADNIHSHPAAQRLAWHAKGGRNIILITDSMRACGMGDGPSELGGQKVFVHGELATLEDGTIAGSVLKMNRAISIFRKNTGAPLPQVIETVTKTPAEELGIYGEIGSIEEGKQADFAIFDEGLDISASIISGKVAYQYRLYPTTELFDSSIDRRLIFANDFMQQRRLV